MANCKWQMANSKWQMANCKLKMANGKLLIQNLTSICLMFEQQIENGKLKIAKPKVGFDLRADRIELITCSQRGPNPSTDFLIYCLTIIWVEKI